MLAPDGVNVILDCGANIGLTSLFFASRYPKACIYSIEPNERNFELLKYNTADNPRIIPIHGAVVGHHCASVRLTTDRPSWANSITDHGGGIEVPAFTVDQIFDHHRLSRIDLLKVDIEGAEEEMFSNSEFLRRVGFVIIELHNDYDRARFSHAIASWSFRAEFPKAGSALKIIIARPDDLHTPPVRFGNGTS
jgi:FkbM family methyltransferase